jgi:uncharacterized protein (TIGR03435 family)
MPARRSDFRKLILLSVAAAIAPSLCAQQPAPDSVTVRESAEGSGHDGNRPRLVFEGHQFHARDASVETLLDYAYGLGPGVAVAGAPDWTRSVKFDVDATISPVTPGDLTATFGHLAQPGLIAALQDAFHLTAHLGPMQGNGMALVVAKGKPRFKLASATGYGGPGIQLTNFGVLEGKGATMDELASALTSASMVPVVNETGLTGRYNFTLRWSPVARVNRDDGAAVRYNLDGSISARVSDVRCVPGQEAAGCNLDEALPSLPLALQGELGLKLESGKVMARTLVIDHIERPANL